jgi:hypothetical protein
LIIWWSLVVEVAAEIMQVAVVRAVYAQLLPQLVAVARLKPRYLLLSALIMRCQLVAVVLVVKLMRLVQLALTHHLAQSLHSVVAVVLAVMA